MFKSINRLNLLIFVSILTSILIIGCKNKSMINTAIDSPNTGNTLNWYLSPYDIDSWDPHINNNTVATDITHQLFEGLTVLGENGYELGVAKSFKMTPNDEGVENTVYTFELRNDCKWSDGQNVTAEDFEYSFKRACDPTIGGKSADMFISYIKGADEYYNGTGSKDDMKVKAIGKYTLKIELNNPTPYFMEILAMQSFIPMRKDIVEKNGIGWETNPNTCVSNGPFKLVSYNPGADLLLSKNNYYHDSENVKISYIKCLINNSNSLYDKDEIYVTQIGAYGDLKSEDILKTNYNSSTYMLFNSNSEIFNDVNVRKAFSYSIDREYISQNIFVASPAGSLVPSGIKLSNGETIEGKIKNDVNLFKIQNVKSKELLKLSGYENNLTAVRLVTNNEIMGYYLKGMLEHNIDAKINLIIVPYDELLEKESKGDFDIIIKSYHADYDDPISFLEMFKSNSNLNFSGWSNKDYDIAIENSMNSEGLNRDNYLIQAENILMDEMVVAPLYFYNKYYYFNSSLVYNIKCDDMGDLILKNAKLNLIKTDNKEENTGDIGVYGFDDRNRIEEIDKNGYFNDDADNKFDKYLISNHFEIYYNSGNVNNKVYAADALKVLEGDYDRILEYLNVEEKNMPIIKINMYDEYEPLRQCLINEINYDVDMMNNLEGITVYSNTIYYTYKFKGRYLDTSTNLKHEFTHCVTMALAKKDFQPDWLWEGTAMYMSQEKDESESNYKQLLENNIPQINALKNAMINRYIYGYSMVEYIIKEYGREKLVELLLEYGDIQKVLNISESEFRNGWIEFLQEKINL